MFRPWVPLLLFCGAASCSSPSPERAESRPLRLELEPDCGIRFVVKRLSPEPESGEAPVESGSAVPACSLPMATAIETACAGKEGVPIPGSHHPDGGEGPQHRFPDYTVQGLACVYSDSARRSADCTFDLVGRSGGPERIEARFHHRFHDLSNEIAHNHLWVGWDTDSICAPAR